ncbi:hypothetical protein ACIGO8_08180 [Streptomyces sp. NPDC053493]|uniref:hypothetical protein n=1 Tax=Streptomyces sp. NPDC053493 TaxID=3365705 RepID=UPI0037CFCDB8
MATMPANTPEDRQRLAEAAAARRRELTLSVAAAAEAAGLAKDTYKRVERGLPIRDSGYIKIDKALRWAPGSAAAILEGAAGAITVERSPGGAGFVHAAIPDEELKGAVTNAIVAVADTLTAREIRDISDRVLAELRQRGLLDEE